MDRNQEFGPAFARHLLIVTGLMAFIPITSFNIGLALAALAIAAGVLILTGR